MKNIINEALKQGISTTVPLFVYESVVEEKGRIIEEYIRICTKNLSLKEEIKKLNKIIEEKMTEIKLYD